MKTIKLKTSTIDSAARDAKMTPEQFVSSMRSISLGREVCAHYSGQDGEFSIFLCE